MNVVACYFVFWNTEPPNHFNPLALWNFYFFNKKCSVSEVSKVTGYGLDSWVAVSGRGRDFLQYLIQTGSGAYTVSMQSVLDIHFQRLKCPWCEADHPALPSAKISYVWSYLHSHILMIHFLDIVLKVRERIIMAEKLSYSVQITMNINKCAQ
jgi:hypothetical protein